MGLFDKVRNAFTSESQKQEQREFDEITDFRRHIRDVLVAVKLEPTDEAINDFLKWYVPQVIQELKPVLSHSEWRQIIPEGGGNVNMSAFGSIAWNHRYELKVAFERADLALRRGFKT